MTARVDISQVTALSRDLAAAPIRMVAQGTQLVHKGVREGRDTAREVFRGQVRELYLPHYANSITHDVTGLSGEFGPDASMPQGGMGRAIEFGSSNHGPIAHMGPAADKLEQAFPDDAIDVAVDALW